MKKLLLFLFVALAGSLHAVSPVPYTETLSFNLKMQGTGIATMTIYDESSSSFNWTWTWANSATSEAAIAPAIMRPGKKYRMTLTGTDGGFSNPGFYSWFSFITPTGYRLYINGTAMDMIPLGWQTSFSQDYDLELRPVSAIADAMPLSSFSGIRLGKSVTWEVGLGSLHGDRNAGRLIFKEYDLSGSPATRSKLFLSLVNNLNEVWSINDGPSNQTLRQVITPLAVIDLLDDGSDGYWIRFFPHSQSEGSPGNPNILYGSPWKTIHVQSPATGQLQITETEGSAVRVSHLTLTSGSISSGSYVWTLLEGDGTTWLRATTQTSTPYSGYREVIETVRTGNASGTVVAKTKYRYEDVGGWGEELTSVIADPDTAALTTSYTYYTNSANLGNYRKVRSVTLPTGAWNAQEYYDDWDRRGQIKYEFYPDLDSPATVTLNPASGRVVYYEYAAGWSGRYSRPTLRQEKINNVITAKITWSHGDIIVSGEWPREYSNVSSYSDGSNYETAYTERFRADAWPTLAFRTTATQGADQAQTSWNVATGTYNHSTGAFTGVNSTIGAIREIYVHGSTSSSGATAVSSWDGHAFKSVYLVANKSTLETVIYGGTGQIARKETWLYTSGAFSLLTWEKFTYDAAGRLTQSVASNGATQDYHYTNGLMDYVIAVDGTRTEYTYDALWRVATVVKKGVAASGSYAAQGDITTTYTYDGANRVTQSVVSGGALSQTSTSACDLAGRLTSSTAPGSYVTSYAYSSGGKITTITLPGGATKTAETHLDGRLKSVTGTAVIAEYYTYNLDSNGRRERILRQVSSGGSIMEYAYRDWLERMTIRQVPSPSGSGYTDQRWYYNSSGQLWKLARTGYANTLYQYDTLGRLFREGLDINANDVLDISSDDRITEHLDVFFLNSSSDWYRERRQYTYATAGSGAATSLGITYDRLTGLPSGRIAQTDSYDIHGNATSTMVVIDRTNKKVTTSTDTSDSNVTAEQITYNGLVMSAKDTSGITTTYGYDALGRPVTSVDPRTGTTTTAYVTGQNQVSTVTDPASITQATYTYDSAGRVATVTNALSKVTRYDYNDRGQKLHEWGNATYPVEYGYDTFGRLYQQKTYAQSTATFTGSTWPGSPNNPQTTTWNYHPATGLLTSKTDANNKTVSYTYTSAGQVATRTWARGIVTTYAYSSTTGELTGVDYSDTTTDLAYTYNRLGQMATGSDYSGTRTFTYNLSGTLELQHEQLGVAYSGHDRLTYGYDTTPGTKGRPNAFQLGTSGSPSADQSIGYHYQSDGRLSTLIAGGHTFVYGYVSNSHLLGTVTNTAANYLDTRTYDAAHDWVDSRTTTISNVAKAAFAYTQDNVGRSTLVAKTGGVFDRYGNGTQGLDTHYTYDDRSQLASEVTKLGGTGTVLTGRNDSSYDYDLLGNRKSVTHNGNTATYTSNLLNQYTQRTVPGVFDVAGAAASGATVTVNSSTSGVTRHGEYFFKGHALTNTSSPAYTTLAVSDGTTTANLPAFVAKTPEAFTYDDDGNLRSDGRWDYYYDAENRPYWVETAAAALSAGHPKVARRFYYDCLGRMFRLNKDSWGGSYWVVDTDHYYIYNGWSVVAEFWGAYGGGGLVSTYSRHSYWGLDLSGTSQGAGGIGGLLMVQEGGNSYLPAYDALGNVHAMIKASDGSIAAAYEYDAFGNTLRESGPYAASNPFRFATKYTDVETGLVYHDTRYYSPSLGRFLNRDSIGEQGGLNLYAYVNNRVPNAWDMLGQDAFLTWYEGGSWGVGDGPTGMEIVDAKNQAAMNISFETYAEGAMANALAGFNRAADKAARSKDKDKDKDKSKSSGSKTFEVTVGPIMLPGDAGFIDDEVTTANIASNSIAAVVNQTIASGHLTAASGNTLYSDGTIPFVSRSGEAAAAGEGGAASTTTTSQPGYWDRYAQHVENYAITLPAVASVIGVVGGSIPKTWVGRQFGPNPLTSFVRGIFGSNPVTTAPIVRQFIVPVISVAGAAVGGYNTGVLLSGFVYAAFPGSNGLPPPPVVRKEPGT